MLTNACRVEMIRGWMLAKEAPQEILEAWDFIRAEIHAKADINQNRPSLADSGYLKPQETNTPGLLAKRLKKAEAAGDSSPPSAAAPVYDPGTAETDDGTPCAVVGTESAHAPRTSRSDADTPPPASSGGGESNKTRKKPAAPNYKPWTAENLRLLAELKSEGHNKRSAARLLRRHIGDVSQKWDEAGPAPEGVKKKASDPGQMRISPC